MKGKRRYVDGMPHVSKIIRNPEPIECEILAIADPITGLVMRIELANSKYADKRENEDNHSKRTAVVLRVPNLGRAQGRRSTLIFVGENCPGRLWKGQVLPYGTCEEG